MHSNPVATFGEGALLLSLVVSALTIAASVAGARRGSRRLVRAGILSAHATTALVTLSSAVMWFLIMSNDYSVKYVQHHSDASMPWYYKLTAFWGGLDGSIMWWVLLLAVFSSIAIHVNKERHRDLIPYVVAVLYTVIAFFMLLIIFEKRPFDLFLTDAPRIGKGMNPLLQNPYMATHPPSLYLGFVSATVPFAFGLAALITGNLDDSWLASTRRWVLVSWYFLAQGLVLGSLWAYEELGWGGYWGWDPVENAGFLPFLTSTAFLHSIMVQERRGMLKVWNVSLVIITFLLTMIGTFMTRSGVVQSVHAFGQDTELAIIFLCFISFVIIFSFGYVIYRLPLLRGRNDLDSWLSREFVFLVNNWILLSAAFFILFATLFPTLSEWIVGERITVGPPFFIQWMTPIGLMLLFLTGVGPLIAWRKASRENLREQFTFPLIALVGTVGLLQLVPELRGWSRWVIGQKWQVFAGHGVPISIPVTSMVICFGLCAFTMTTILQEFLRGTRVRQANTKLDFFTSLVGLVGRNKRRYGGYIVHIAVVMMFIGFAGDGYKRETEATLEPGKSVTLEKYTVRFDGLVKTADAQKEMVTATASVFIGGELAYVLHPAKWAYKHHEDEPPTTEVDIHKTLKEDLYLILNGFEGNGTLANLKVVINPLVNWIWLGFVLLAIGTVICYLPERAYLLASKTVPGDKAAAVAALLVVMWLGAPAHADSMGMEAAGNELHIARSDRERGLFHQLKCLCNCMHSLNECGGECGPGARRRFEVQKLIDQGQADQQILDWELSRYGQEVLRIPPDHGFNRLAWVLPIGGLLAAAGGLIYAGRRWVKKKAVKPDAPAQRPDDNDYEDKLDDELDKLS